MNREDAEEFTQALGQVVAGSWRQIAWAERQGIPAALGLSTEQWVKDRLGGYIRMSIPERREAVTDLTADGFSTRQIAGIVGVSNATVSRDAANVTRTEFDEAIRKAREEEIERARTTIAEAERRVREEIRGLTGLSEKDVQERVAEATEPLHRELDRLKLRELKRQKWERDFANKQQQYDEAKSKRIAFRTAFFGLIDVLDRVKPDDIVDANSDEVDAEEWMDRSVKMAVLMTDWLSRFVKLAEKSNAAKTRAPGRRRAAPENAHASKRT